MEYNRANSTVMTIFECAVAYVKCIHFIAQSPELFQLAKLKLYIENPHSTFSAPIALVSEVICYQYLV